MILISFIFTIFLIGSKLIKAEECSSENTCECLYSDGSGYSLKDLIQPSDSFISGYAQNNTEIYFSPCSETKSTPWFPDTTVNECKTGYTLCFYNATEKHAYVLGTLKDTKIKEDGGQIYMTFGVKNISSILLQCAVDAKISILYAPKETNQNNISLTLFSNNACRKQIKDIESPGFFSTFFLIAFIVLLSYLVIGIVYNYFFVGARGYELLPNYDFWTRVWMSIKLGYLFVKNGFRVVPTEDSYDAI